MTGVPPQTPPSDSGPDFGKVFSVTLKVFLALLLISVIVGVVFLVLGGIGKVAENASDSSADWKTTEKKVETDRADGYRTLVPVGEWNKLIAAAVKVHCPLEGMTKEEMQRAIGKPIASDPTTWRYERTVEKECMKYNGDKCAEPTQQVETESFTFTPSGHLLYPESDHGGNWLHLNCFGEPFFGRYYKPLLDKDTERVRQESDKVQRELDETLHRTEAK